MNCSHDFQTMNTMMRATSTHKHTHAKLYTTRITQGSENRSPRPMSSELHFSLYQQRFLKAANPSNERATKNIFVSIQLGSPVLFLETWGERFTRMKRREFTMTVLSSKDGPALPSLGSVRDVKSVLEPMQPAPRDIEPILCSIVLGRRSIETKNSVPQFTTTTYFHGRKNVS